MYHRLWLKCNYTPLHTPLFFQNSTLLHLVKNTFRISSYCYIQVCFSFIFLLIWRICFHSGPPSMIFMTTIFFHLVNLKQLPMVLTPFVTFQLSSGMHWLNFCSFADFKTKIQRVTFIYILFACTYLSLKL